jgi:hypothetical protein
LDHDSLDHDSLDHDSLDDDSSNKDSFWISKKTYLSSKQFCIHCCHICKNPCFPTTWSQSYVIINNATGSLVRLKIISTNWINDLAN